MTFFINLVAIIPLVNSITTRWYHDCRALKFGQVDKTVAIIGYACQNI